MAQEVKRIQRKRTKGWKMPGNAVYVGRPTKWGNPYTVREHGTRSEVVQLYRRYIMCKPGLLSDLDELVGKDLACWCPLDQPCHADVLIELGVLWID